MKVAGPKLRVLNPKFELLDEEPWKLNINPKSQTQNYTPKTIHPKLYT